MLFGPTSWCLSWDLALVREALLQGPIFCITFLPPARPRCNPQPKGPWNLEMDPVTFSDAGTAPLGLVHFYPVK